MNSQNYQLLREHSPPFYSIFYKLIKQPDMKKLFISLLSLILLITTKAQLTKGNWLLGGNASFSRLESSSTASVQSKQTDVQISPIAGFFFEG